MMLWLVLVMLLASPAWSATYYVQLSPGSPAANCTDAQNISTPHDTIAEGVACLSAGDTLYLRAGTYTQAINLMSPTVKTGTVGNPITIAGYPGETIIIRYTESVVNGIGGIRARGNIKYIIWENLKIDGVNYADGAGWQIRDGNSNFTIRNVEIYNQFYNGLYLDTADNITIDSVNMHDFRTDCVKNAPTGHRWQGVYARNGSNLIVKNSRFDYIPAQGIRVDPGPWNGVTLDRNLIQNSNYCPENVNAAVVIGTVGSAGGVITNVTFSRNIIAHNGYPYLTFEGGYGGGMKVIRYSYDISNVKIVNNVIYDNIAPADADSGDSTNRGWGLQFISGVPLNTEIKNNVIMDNEEGALRNVNLSGVTVSHNACTSALFCGSSNKVTLATVGACLKNVANGEFSQVSGSTCIDAGTDVGAAYNGNAPDVGAFETFLFASCEVPFGAANTIRVTFTSNANFLGSTLTTFTARRNGSNNALTGAASKIGDNIISLPLTTTYVGGDTADISWASGGLTDQTLIGGTLNQPFLPITNQSCTNNAGSAVTNTFTQATHRHHGVFGLEAAPSIRSAEGASTMYVIKGGAVRTRFAITCGGADCPPTGFYLYYSTGGGYAVIPNTFDSGNIAFCGSTYVDATIPENGSVTTNQLSTAGTFVPGALVFTSNAIPTITGLNNGYKTELEYCIRFDSDASGSYTLRVYQQDGTALDTYTVTPTISIVNAQALGGF